MRFDRELVKGSTSLLLLQVLNEGDLYGYQLVKEIERRSGDQLQMKEGTLYPALHKLEAKGFISHYWKEAEQGPRRKYYALTPDGRRLLEEKTSEWNAFVSMMNRMLGEDR